MRIINGTRRESTSKFQETLQKAENHIVNLCELGSLDSGKVTQVKESFRHLRTEYASAHEDAEQLLEVYERFEVDRDRAMSQKDAQEMEELKDTIVSQLDNHDFPYSYATVVWSPNNLWGIQYTARETIKTILREYFEGRNLKFDGWAPSDRINPTIDSLPDSDGVSQASSDYVENLIRQRNAARL